VEVHIGQVGAVEIGLPQVCSTQIRSAQIQVTKVSPGQFCATVSEVKLIKAMVQPNVGVQQIGIETIENFSHLDCSFWALTQLTTARSLWIVRLIIDAIVEEFYHWRLFWSVLAIAFRSHFGDTSGKRKSTMNAGKLEAIWLKRARRGPMDPKDHATLQANRGLVGNTDQGGKRQVTIIEKEVWAERTAQAGVTLDPVTRRANLMVSGIALANTRGRVLQIGQTRLRIYGETKPCERMDEAHNGLRATLYEDWGGGAFAEVLDDGEIAVGDPVRWMD
jgi:MOSC domain-containing protein YiiM